MRNLHTYRYVILSALLLLVAPHGYGQARDDLAQIAASQGVASPLTYTTANKEIPSIEIGNYTNEAECNVRGGLPGFNYKIRKGDNVTVAFIGGSITQGEYCYRLQITNYIEQQYPNINFKWINAGVSGTGADLGAFRIGEQVLSQRPDLVFIEFAVNGGFPDGVEGMIRQIIRRNPFTDISLLYAISNGQPAAYQSGGMPPVIANLEEIAEHYNIPSIHMGMESSQLERDGKLVWRGSKEDAQGKILFSNDGVHPITEGGNLYASAIARGLRKIENHRAAPKAHPLPSPLIGDDWDEANMYVPSQLATFDSHWKEIATKSNKQISKFDGWFDTVMTSGEGGASFSFKFEGDMFGVFDVGGPEVGMLEMEVDGKPIRLTKVNTSAMNLYHADPDKGEATLNRFNQFCNNRYRGQYDVVKLEKGLHEVTVRISPAKSDKSAILGDKQQADISQNPEKYDQTVIYLGRILLRGKPILPDKPTPTNQQKPKLTQQEKWEQKMVRYEKYDAENPPRKNVILFVGSSTIENWKTLQSDFPGRYILNRGVSGTKTVDLFNYRDRLIYPYQPKQIFIYEGDNDIGYKWLPERILAQFEQLFFDIRENRPDAEIIFISIKPSPRRLKDTEAVEKTNSLIKAFIEQQDNARYADVYTPAFNNKGELYGEHYREDGLHLTPEGYEVWRRVISKFIK